MQKLSGFGFRGFRSVYADLQLLAPLSDVNLIAGQNNSGKSNALLVAHHLKELLNQPPKDLDVPRSPSPPVFEIAVRLGDRASVLAKYCEKYNLGDAPRIQSLDAVLTATAFDLQDDNSVWLKRAQISATDANLSFRGQAEVLNATPGYLATKANQIIGNVGSPGPLAICEEFLKRLWPLFYVPDVKMVEASRRPSDRVDDKSLIERLSELQHPDINDDEEYRARFATINGFVRTVIDDKSASLEIPDSKAEIYVRRQNLLLPLRNLGSGISQVIMLAAYAAVLKDTVVCIEEPEVHIHPVLQRKLLRYLKYDTDNQYLIATHSAHLLDSAIASIFHATLTSDGTVIRFAGTAPELTKICSDLGYRASDLLQANCTIWVEGPSDRLYVAHWLKLMAPKLKEGIDYSIMFYGGRLLSHLSTEDPSENDVVEDFISLRRLNRHLVVVIDSDKSSAAGQINSTKSRIRDEITDGDDPGHVWITQGRYIESYIPPGLLTVVLTERYPNKSFADNIDEYTDALRPSDQASTFRPLKIRVADEVCKRWSSGLDYLDLYDRVEDLANFIEQANGHETPPRPARSSPDFVGT